jgi:uncharacterized protein (DUF2062 family)
MRGKIGDKIKLIFYVKDPPWKIALTFSIGLFIGMSPFIGFHTVIAIGVAILFRLNKVVILLATYFTNPWTIVPIYTFSTFIGARILHNEIKINIDWAHITLSEIAKNTREVLLPFIFGTLVVGFISSVLSYIIIYAVLTKRRRLHRDSGLS